MYESNNIGEKGDEDMMISPDIIDVPNSPPSYEIGDEDEIEEDEGRRMVLA